MGEFDYRVVADGSAAEATNKRIDAQLDKITANAGQTGKAIGSALGNSRLKDAAGNFVATSTASEKLRAHVDELTESWQREDAVLERIHGPAKEYEADLKALGSLHTQGAISAKEFEKELERLNEKRSRHGDEHEDPKLEGLGKTIAGKFGEGGNLIGGILSSGAVEAAGIAGLGSQLVEISDEYTKMSNAARRVGDSTHTVNETMHQQLDLAGRLHSSYEETIELTDVIRNRTEDLNLSNTQRLKLTESLGMAANIEGKSVGSAAGSMERLAFALDEGLPAGKALKQIFMEFPPIQEAMEEHFHKSGRELIAMGNQGKIGMDEFTNALIFSKKIAEEHAKIGETFGEKWHHGMAEVKMAVGEGLDSVTKGINTDDMIKRLMTTRVRTTKEIFDALNAGMEKEKQIEEEAAFGKKFREEIGKMPGEISKFSASLGDLSNSMSLLNTSTDAGARALGGLAGMIGLAKDAWQGDLSTQEKLIKGSMDHAAKMGQARQELATLKSEVEAGTISWKEYEGQLRTLTDTLEGGRSAVRELYYSITDGVRKNNEMLEAAFALHRSGAISAQQFENAIHKLREEAFAPLEQQLKRNVVAYDEATAAAARYRDEAAHGVASAGAAGLIGSQFAGVDRAAATELSIGKKFDTHAEDQLDKQEQLYAKVIDVTEPTRALKQFEEGLAIVNEAKKEGILTDEDYQKRLGDLREKFDDIKTPAEEYRKKLDEIKARTDAGIYSTEQNARAVALLSAQYDHSAAQGFENGLQKIHAEMLDVASLADKTLVDAFHGVEDALVEMATTGQINFTKMIDSMLADLARLAIREIEMEIVSSFSSGGGLPMHDMGASWTVGGSGGADTSLQAFWASPGETISVTPAGGSTSSRRESNRPIVVENHNHFDRRELLSSVRTYDGRVTLYNEMRSTSGALRTLLQK